MRGTVVVFCLALAMFGAFAAPSTPLLARTTDGAPLAGATADLFKAVEVNDMPGVKAAIAAGADVNAKNAAGKTPADLAVDRGHFIIAHFLLSQRTPSAAPSPPQAATKAPPKAAAKPAQPAPRRLTPPPQTAPTLRAEPKPELKTQLKPKPTRAVTSPLQPKARFSAPPAKPEPGTEKPEMAEALKPATRDMAKSEPTAVAEPARGLTPPPLAKRTARFAPPPRKPQQPLPEAVEVGKAPGSSDLPPLSEAPPNAMPAEPAVAVGDLPPTGARPDVAAELPPAGPSDATLPAELADLPPATEAKPKATADPAMPAPMSEAKPVQAPPTAKTGPAAPLGQVGQFFRNLLDMVTPDDAAVAPGTSARQTGTTPGNASGRATASAGKPDSPMAKPAPPSRPVKTAETDAKYAADLEKSFGLTDKDTAAPPGDVVELKEMEAPGNTVRRVPAPGDMAVRRSVPAPKVSPAPIKEPADSATARTLDRLGDLVGKKPKEDEFGLPKVEITGSPSERPEPLPPAAVAPAPVASPAPAPAAAPARIAAPGKAAGMPASAEPTLESLLGTAPELKPTTKAGSAPNIDDAPGPERNDPLAIDEGAPTGTRTAPGAVAGAPKAAPKTPVASAAMPTPSGKLRYMSTTERLRRLNEALAREVPLDGPSRRNLPVLSDRMADYMITGDQPQETPARGKLPPSSLPTRPLTQRETPGDRFVDRLERIRRNAYDEEQPAEQPESPKAPAQAQAPRIAATPAPTEPPAAAAPSEPAKGESALSKLVKFFKKSDTKNVAADSGAGTADKTKALNQPPQAVQIARQTDYRSAPDVGSARNDLPRPKTLSEEAIKQTSEPQPGQTAGRMSPGFLDHLSKLFTDEKVAEKGWAAEVEINHPKAPSAAPAPTMRPVPKAQTGEAAAAPRTPPAGAAASLLPPPSGDLPPDAGAAWTTTVEMATDTGNPMVLGVVKTPVPAGTSAATAPRAPAATRMAAAAPPTPAATQPPAQGESIAIRDSSPPPGQGGNITIKDDGLPPAEGENIVINNDGLPPAQGEAPVVAPMAKIDDLPPAQGEAPVVAPMARIDDLPPAQGEAPVVAPKAKPAPARVAATKQPYSDPLQRPMPTPAQPAPAAKPLGRTAELMPGPGVSAPVSGERRLRPDERLTEAPTEPKPGQTMAKSGQSWPIIKLAKHDDMSPPVHDEQRPKMLSRTSLSGVNLALGESVSLENTLPPGGGIDDGNRCVKKNRGTTLFCIEPVDWPEQLKAKFTVPTILYTGPMAIVRYDQGTASRLHALFPSADFESVVQYYTKRYGPPTEIWKRYIAPLAQARRENPTVAWRNRDPRTNAVTILELRQYDDSRGGFPDTQRGAVMLYLANSPAIFPQVSSHELMRLNREKGKQAASQG